MAGDIRIGMHGQGFNKDHSEALIAAVPEPSSITALGLGGLILLGKKKAAMITQCR